MSLYRIVGGDVGTTLIFTVREWPVTQSPDPNTQAPVVDLSSATSLQLVILPPKPILTQAAASQTVTATLYTDGTDGRIQYTTVAGDIPVIPFGGTPQLWHVRPKFTLSGWTGQGEPDTFWVDP